jgi:hypothetical protein
MHPLNASLRVPNKRYLITLCDLRRLGAEQRLRRELAAWRGFAHAESSLAGRVVLVIQPGGASGGAR